MVSPIYPSNPTIGDTHNVGNITFRWDGEKWKSIAPANHENRITQSELDVSSLQDSRTSNFLTLNAAVISTDTDKMFDGAVINIKERGAMWDVVLSSTVTENAMDFVQCTGVGVLSLVLRKDGVMTPMMYGYNLTASDMTSTAIVSDNWDIMKYFINDVKDNNLTTSNYKTLCTTESLHAEWVAGRTAPVGFYSDSTTDGATTTGHVASFGTDSPFEVTINSDLNAYPARLQAALKEANADNTIPVECYNGGFDSQSFLNGFGLKHWYNTWFRSISGSNKNWTDVKMIVQGFGTSDSSNLNDTAAVITAYELDLECVIIDSFLRGVQPALQGPVPTTQNTGILTSGRKGWQSVEIIEAVQSRLAAKYNLQFFSYRDAWIKIFSNFTGTEFRDFMSSDMVHPNDNGHNIHASYLSTFFNKNIQTLKDGEKVNSLYAGHQCYQTDPDDNISGDNILKYVPNLLGISDESYIYQWIVADGDSKTAGDLLVKVSVYVDKPMALLMKDVESNRVARDINIQSYYLGSNVTPTPAYQTQDQPTDEFYSHKSFVSLLPPGLNTITVDSADTALNQSFGGFYLVDLEQMNFNYDRGTNLAKVLNFPDVLSSYTPQARPSKNLTGYYDPQDQAFLSLSFNVSTAVVSGTPAFIRTHYNDVSANRDSYNKFIFSADNFIISVVDDGVETAVTTRAVSGLNALLVSGAIVELKMRSRFSTPNGLNIQLFVDGVVRDSYNAAVGEMWTDGYGFDTDILCRNIQLVSSVAQTGFADLNKLI